MQVAEMVEDGRHLRVEDKLESAGVFAVDARTHGTDYTSFQYGRKGDMTEKSI